MDEPIIHISRIEIRYYFFLIVLLYVLVSFVTNEYLITDDQYYRTLGEQLSINQIDELLDLKEKWSWLGYLLVPLIISIKIFLVATVLKIGAFLGDIHIRFSQFFHAAILAEMVFVVALIVKTVWLFINGSNTDLTYIQSFYPLSAINLVNYKEIASWSVYAIQVLNLFELLYWFVLAFILKGLIRRSFWKSFEFVLSTYGLALFVWVIFVVFLNLNFS